MSPCASSNVEKVLFQNLTKWIFTNLKSDFQVVFSEFRWIIIKVLPTSKNNLLKNYNGVG